MMHTDHGRALKGSVCTSIIALVVAAAAPTLVAQMPVPSSWVGAYTAEQAKRGQTLYNQNCASCHGGELAGGLRAPAAGGPAFVAKWSGRPLSELLDYMLVQMPLNSPGGLTRHQNADILAFMLQRSGATTGAKDLWVDGLEGEKAPPQRSADYGKVAEPSTKRAEAFFTEGQAERGRIVFDHHCAYCHSMDPKLSTPKDLVAPLPSTFAGPFIERVVNDKVVYPNALALYSKLQSMPGANTRSISDQQRVDVMAHILRSNGLPAGDHEIPLNTDAMRLMMLNEPGFERIFNGKDLTGWNVALGLRCQTGPSGCAKFEPGGVLRVDNETIVCECYIHGDLYTDKKYESYTLRFDTRFERPAYYAPEDDDELFSGGSGYLIQMDFSNPERRKSIEVEGRQRDILEFFASGRPSGSGKVGQIDIEAKRRAIRPLGQWNAIEISFKGGHVRTKLNGVSVSSLDIEGYNYPGHIVFQVQGAKIYWRNIRIRIDQ